jgi:hypothetical protein
MSGSRRTIDQWSHRNVRKVGRQLGAQYDPDTMKASGDPKPPPPRLVRWWESLETWIQLAISFPIFAVLTFVVNLGVFDQPLLRSILYGLFEGAVLSGLMAVATATERGRRS